jgi:hypothetical protein
MSSLSALAANRVPAPGTAIHNAVKIGMNFRKNRAGMPLELFIVFLLVPKQQLDLFHGVFAMPLILL